MKKLILIISLVVILTAGVITEQILIDNYLNEIKKKTEYLISITQGKENIQTEQISSAVADLKKTWIHHEEVLCFFANHKDMRDLCVEIQKLEANISVNQYEDLSASLHVILHLSDDYHKIMGISCNNIF